MLRSILKYWFPVAIWMVVIFAASTNLGSPSHSSRLIEPFLRWLGSPESVIQLVHYCTRKAGHVLEYGILALLLWRALNSHICFRSVSQFQQVAAVILLCAFYAGTDELHQFFVKTRECSSRDVLLDSAGALAATILKWRTNRKQTTG